MCKPVRDGGQRCASHTRAALETAQAKYGEHATPENFDALQGALAEFASTPTGKKEILAQRDALAADNPGRIDLDRALQRGQEIRERNKEVAAQVRAETKYRRLAGSESAHDRVQAACRSRDSETLRMLAEDPFSVYLLAANRATPVDVLQDLHSKWGRDWMMGRALAENESTPAEILTDLARRKNEDVWDALAYNPSTHTEVLIRIRDRGGRFLHAIDTARKALAARGITD